MMVKLKNNFKLLKQYTLQICCNKCEFNSVESIYEPCKSCNLLQDPEIRIKLNKQIEELILKIK